MKLFLLPLLTNSQGQGPRSPLARPSVSSDSIFTEYLSGNQETLTAVQYHQTNDYFPFKRKCLHMLSCHVSFSSLETSSGPPCFMANEMLLCVRLSACLLSLLLLYVCLSVCLYLFISAFWALLFCLLIFVNMGLTSAGQVSPLKWEPAIALKTDL